VWTGLGLLAPEKVLVVVLVVMDGLVGGVARHAAAVTTVMRCRL
jgi:hypothetical protein